MLATKWDLRFLTLAKHISEWSKDPSTKCGAVIADADHRVISLGYNGFPSRLSDDVSLYENREEKYKRVVHCEMNAILFARQPLTLCELYTWPFLPCIQCVPMVIQAGFRRVISPHIGRDNPLYDRWNTGNAFDILKASGVDITLIASMVTAP